MYVGEACGKPTPSYKIQGTKEILIAIEAVCEKKPKAGDNYGQFSEG